MKHSTMIVVGEDVFPSDPDNRNVRSAVFSVPTKFEPNDNVADQLHDMIFSDDRVEYTTDGTPMVNGDWLFELKATHGLPLDIAIDEIINNYQYVINWPQFIEAARRNKWWDFKTFDEISYSLVDADIDKQTQKCILDRCKLYIMAHPHPMMI